MRWALRAAAAAPESVAQPEPVVVLRIGRPDRRTLLVQWLAKGSRKEKGTNPVLKRSRLILLRRGRHQSSPPDSRYQLARSATIRGPNCRIVSGHAVWSH